jgi:hypothetical protein
MADLFIVDLDPTRVRRAEERIADVIAQAQAGVTVFSPRGIMAGILLDLDMSSIVREN